MLIFDNNSNNVVFSNDSLIVYSVPKSEELVFKASFVVIGDIMCTGKITALFDLVVFGNISASDIDVKGKLVCVGKCSVKNMMSVQNGIWSDSIEAHSIISHDSIMAREIETTDIISDGCIVLEKTLAVEGNASTSQKLICGETAYGAGLLSAELVITGEPVDLDEGEDAIALPHIYGDSSSQGLILPVCIDDKQFRNSNDYVSYLSAIKKGNTCGFGDNTIDEWSSYLAEVENSMTDLGTLRDLSILLNLLEIIDSKLFDKWPTIGDWKNKLIDLFKNLSNGVDPFSKITVPTTLDVGDEVVHDILGRGRVTDKTYGAHSKSAQVSILFGSIKNNFYLPRDLKHFILVDGKHKTKEDIIKSVVCKTTSYGKLLKYLSTTEEHKDELSKSLYDLTCDLLASNLGLKSKYINDRLKEKGWK